MSKPELASAVRAELAKQAESSLDAMISALLSLAARRERLPIAPIGLAELPDIGACDAAWIVLESLKHNSVRRPVLKSERVPELVHHEHAERLSVYIVGNVNCAAALSRHPMRLR
jgi:hypothetical protein